jgi:hypothetical protein
LKENIYKQSFTADSFTNGEFKTIYYAEIDLDNTEALLKKQGLLIVELRRPRAWTLIALLNQNDKYDFDNKSRPNIFFRYLMLIFDLSYSIPMILFNANITILFCIYVNHCNTAEWKKLQNGYYQFVLM